MAKIPGTLDGQKFEDMRELMPGTLIQNYQMRGMWDNITRIKFPVSEKKDIVIVHFSQGKTTYAERWVREEFKWAIVDKEVLNG